MKKVLLIGISSLFIFAGCSTQEAPTPVPTPTPAPLPAPAPTTPTPVNSSNIEYRNNEYGFRFALPTSWKGYSIVAAQWEGFVPGGPQGDVTTETGPMISIRHPQYTSQNPRQDIPIMVLTINQWNSLQQDKFHIGAAPINPSELGRNSTYVFALPARYNYAFPTGFEEVEKILQDKSLQAF